ncbi:hypothetical protein BU24DRAFT_478162 [Aaosphaeria arxii CBS 175.79]|uniref:Uncharacterized protein n=1 Tax=Aaosphaeria arxii CBS 175.79 TaxID=1450172 RepID=A0A6A5XW20_9PLEO|nr:uncharacterized protein BU24DRAFT_478162 [Aaosphaeria arxii CBS 175.79]KAF2017136.1 hypothetical protein BU24DRAFT_478162 [Aaosphaeria arxii CBS 175.79]
MPKAEYIFPSDPPKSEDNLGEHNISRDIYVDYDGFVPESFAYLDVSPALNVLDSTFSWTIYRSRPRVKALEHGDKVPGEVKHLQLGVILYRARIHNNPTADNKHRFVLIGPGPGVYKSRENKFMRARDLAERLLCPDRKQCKKDIQNYNQAADHRDASLLPFRVWDTEGVILGNTPFDSPENFFSELLFSREDPNSVEYAEKIFIRYIEMGSAASFPPKEPYSVISRFFDVKVEGIDLYFVLGEKLEKEVLESNLKKLQEKTTKRRFVPRNCYVKSQKEMEEEKKTKSFEVIGTHPMLHYYTWVTRDHYAILKAAKAIEERYVYSDTSFNRVEKIGNSYFLSFLTGGPGGNEEIELPLADIGDTTRTEITKLKLNAARGKPRNPTQARAMRIGSNAAAQPTFKPENGPKTTITDVEWLHRSAFSYGGLGAGLRLESSQDLKNLFLGTKATNTAMLRVEQLIKHYVIHKDKTVVVTTETEDKSNPLLHTANWLAPVLLYRFNIPDDHLGGNFELKFDARARLTPLRYDLELGELIDRDYFKYDKELDLDLYEEEEEAEPSNSGDNDFA